jgi:tetratricopeptide (TPR) repeat protein
VTSTTFWLENRAGLSIAARHAVNVLLHGVVTAFVVWMAVALGFGPGAACVLGLLFALHPVHVEAVAGLVGRAELLAAAFVLCALFLHDRAPAGGTPGGARAAAWGWGALLAFLAAGSKESAWALPLYAVILDLSRRRAPWAAWPAQGGYAAGLLAYFMFRHAALGEWLHMRGYAPEAFDNPLVDLLGQERFLGGLRVVGLNFAHLVFPRGLSPDYSGWQISLEGGNGDPRLWAGALLLLGSLAAAVTGLVRVFRGRPYGAALLVGGGWLLVPALLFMNLFVTLGTVLADRLLYWPSVAWVLLAGAVLVPLLRARVAVAALALLAVAYGWGMVQYLPHWKNDLVLFTYASRVTPDVPRVWYNLGHALQLAGKHEEALEAYREARTLWSSYEEAWAQEATVLLEMGRPQEAQAAMDEARALNPSDVVLLVNEGAAWGNAGDDARAAARFEEVLARYPGQPEALYNLAGAQTRLGRHEEAAQTWRRYLGVRPKDVGAKNNLAWLLAVNLNRPAPAEVLARQAVKADSTNVHYMDTLAEVLFRLGRREEALRYAEAAAAGDTSAYYREQVRKIREDAPPPPASP